MPDERRPGTKTIPGPRTGVERGRGITGPPGSRGRLNRAPRRLDTTIAGRGPNERPPLPGPLLPLRRRGRAHGSALRGFSSMALRAFERVRIPEIYFPRAARRVVAPSRGRGPEKSEIVSGRWSRDAGRLGKARWQVTPEQPRRIGISLWQADSWTKRLINH